MSPDRPRHPSDFACARDDPDDREYARDYARLWSPLIRPLAEAVIPHAPLSGARRILDVGTGCGALMPALRAAAPGAVVVGFDRSLAMARSAGAGGSPVAVMDAQAPGVRSGSFDAALVAFVLFMLPDPVAALREVRRILRPGGVLAAVTWGEDRFSLAETAWEEELVAAGAPARPAHASTHLVDSPAKLGAVCDGAGLPPRKAWSETFEVRESADGLLERKTSLALVPRFRDLPPDRRDSLLRRVRDRFREAGEGAFAWRPEVIYCVAAREGA